MAPANNWLSFSLSPLEILTSSQPQLTTPDDTSHQYLIENFYTQGWGNNKTQVLYSTEEQDHARYEYKDFSILGPNIPNTTRKLEDFLGESSSSMVTETHDSSLITTHNNYQHQHQDLKAITGFQSSFSANSGSEVEDSSPHQLTEFGGGGHSIESAVGSELGQGQTPNCGTNNNGGGGLSLGGVNEKAIVVTSESSKKMVDTFGQRTSIYRGVTRHRWTGRYEAHLWDNSCRREGQARKGRQVYLGGYDKEDKAARAYDLAALKYWGPTATTNFPISNYAKELEEMKHVTKQEFIASLRRKSSGFSRGASIYRGVTRHHQQGRWQARIGRVAGNKDLYLGTFATEEEAAEAYDIAAIKFRGLNAVTNFEMNRYDVEAIMKSALPIGGAAKRSKLTLESDQKPCLNYDQQQSQCSTGSNSISFAGVEPVSTVPCGVPYDPSTTALYQYGNLYQLPSTVGGAPALTMPPPAEFFLWPHHQSY